MRRERATDSSRTVSAGNAAWGTPARSHRVAHTPSIQATPTRAIGEEWLPDEDQLRTVTGRLTKKGAPVSGSTITREWRGRTLVVHVVEDGFEHEGVRYGSLSAVAFAITGTKWNGKLFFGLAERKRK